MTDSERTEWMRVAPAERVLLQGVQSPLYLAPKVFKSGSVGWYCSTKAVIGDSPCQVNLCITVIGTKREATNGRPQEPGDPLEGGEEAPTEPSEPAEGKKGPKSRQRAPKGS